MELKQLEYFLAAAKSGALSRAAILLSVGQPALSRHIKALEEELGAELYHRTGRGIVLTDAGKILADHARSVLEQTARAKSEIQDLGAAPSGRAVIGMPPSVAAVFTVPLVQRFRKEFPKASLVVMEGFSGHVLEWLTSGCLDVAILYNIPSIGSLALEPLFVEKLMLLGPPTDPARVCGRRVDEQRLATVPLILPSRPHAIRAQLEAALEKANIKGNILLEINAMPSTLKLVELGIGYTILPYSCVHELVTQQRVRAWPIDVSSMTRELVLATATLRPIAKAARELGRMVRLEVTDLKATGLWGRPR